MTVAIMTIIMIAILAVVVLTLAYNQSRLARGVAQGRTRALYRAQAGLVDAKERIRLSSCPACKGSCTVCNAACAGCDYENVGFDPDTYYLDLETGSSSPTFVAGVSDAEVVMGQGDANNIRQIVATGYEQ